MQQVVSDMSKLKRWSFFNVAILTGVAEIVWQATSWSRKCEVGCHHPTLGRTIILPANRVTAGLQHGSFRETRSQNGKCPRPGVPFYGFMGNVR